MSRPCDPLPDVTTEELLKILRTHGVQGTCQHLRLNPRQLLRLRAQHQIQRDAVYPIQRMVLEALRVSGPLRAQDLKRLIDAQRETPVHRQYVWDLCQILVQRGILTREGHGRSVVYAITEHKDIS